MPSCSTWKNLHLSISEIFHNTLPGPMTNLGDGKFQSDLKRLNQNIPIAAAVLIYGDTLKSHHKSMIRETGFIWSQQFQRPSHNNLLTDIIVWSR